ncbi:Mapk8ip3 [Acrasis kona]|uniref:Mapk8ip3 n=1 Tax=Acrasis kona TaxID=1008807 RepID=A0AAW2Z4G4_9EUKA
MARDFNSQALSEKQLQKKEKIDSILAIKTGKINAVLADPELCEKKRTKLQQRMDKVLSRCEARKALIDMSNEDRRAYRLNARREKLQSKIAQVQVKIMHTEDADEKEKLEKKLKKFHEKLQSREKQDDSNDSQEDVKELKKQERETKKAQRKLERASNKLVESEAKKARRELGKEDKKKNKQEVNQKLQEDLQVVFELGDVQELYLDGNNMLFVPDCLRSLVFNNKKKAEDILCKFALDF